MEGIIPKTENIVQELLEEDLQREIERNAAANRIAMEREREALAARKRAAESQRMMKEMVTRYETMKKKLDFTKKALQDTNNRIETQERVTAKLDDMKKRLTNYSDRKDALSKKESATDPLDALLTLTEEEEEKDDDFEEAEKRQEELKNAMTDHAANVMKLQNKLIEEGDKLKKKAELREWLEKQVELGEQKALEQEKITKEKEDLLKKKEEELQQQKQNKQQKELHQQQQQQPQQTAQKQLGAKPKQRQKSRSKSKSCTPKLMSPEPVVIDSSKTIPETVETDVSPLDMIKIDGTEDMTVTDTGVKTVKVEEESVNTEDTESVKINIQETVKKIEGKCATVRGNLADMAMSEQYLRTKQALLLAKKKEKEMEVAETVASLREKEVMKMREKVKQMQELLNNRKLKLKITEDIMDKKDMQKTGIEKMMENKQERQKHMEKQLIAKKLFE